MASRFPFPAYPNSWFRAGYGSIGESRRRAHSFYSGDFPRDDAE